MLRVKNKEREREFQTIKVTRVICVRSFSFEELVPLSTYIQFPAVGTNKTWKEIASGANDHSDQSRLTLWHDLDGPCSKTTISFFFLFFSCGPFS